jgi:hypothetical protein
MGKLLYLTVAVMSVFGASLIAKPADARQVCQRVCDGGSCEGGASGLRMEIGSVIVVGIGTPVANGNRHLSRRQQPEFRAASLG